ncbi:MAG: kelch repeat-containing protein, partial [Blastocatellia bacterium]
RSVEIYDPATGKWTDGAPLNVARFDHIAVLLRDGAVLVAGGRNAGGVLDSIEVYDPVTAKWTVNANKLNVARAKATATLLPLSALLTGGTVLIVGGENSGGVLKEADLYDSITKKWTLTGSLAKGRSEHTATLMPNGRVMVVGGGDSNSASLKTAEIYDPRTGSWSDTRTVMNVVRRQHTATLLGDGSVLVAAGFDGTNALNSSELFNPIKQTWMVVSAAMNDKRRSHTATLLQNGQVLVIGGFDGSAALKTSELFTPSNKTWTKSVAFNDGRFSHTATMMPNGRVLLVAGNPNSTVPLASTELHDPAQGTWTYTQSSANTPTVMSVPRANHTATLLANGKVLVAGGSDYFVTHRSSDLFDATTGQWQPTGDLRTERQGHTATLLADGRVLVAGGQLNNGTVLDTAEIYDPATGAWNFTGTMTLARFNHTATLLPSGRVLVIGGSSTGAANSELGTNASSTVEVFDPATNQWTRLTPMKASRQQHTATLLPNGIVLVAGGILTSTSQTAILTAELYNPATTESILTGSMNVARFNHSASLLAGGKVLVMGGPHGTAFTAVNYTGSAETYDPATGVWTKTSVDPPFRRRHSANVLPNGKVLLAGGFRYVAATANTSASIPSTNETLLYDPETDGFEGPASTAKLNSSRTWGAATILPGGKVLTTGGAYYFGTTLVSVFSSAEIYDVGLNTLPVARPSINTASWGGINKAVCVSGVQFQGASEGDSGDAQNSPANYPVIQMMRLDNEQIVYLSPDPNATTCAGGLRGWTNNTYASLAVTAGNFAKGAMLLTVFTNGIPSSKAFTLAPDTPAATPNTPLNINISGRVYDINGAGFPATLTIRGSDGSLRVIQNGANGEYSFPELPSAKPAQSLTSLTPSSANIGGNGLTLVVNGSGFTDRSVVLWNGSARSTQFTNSQRLTATLSANDLGTPGTNSVAVFTAGLGTTNALTFKLNTPAPIITAIDPATAVEGSAGFTLTVTGQNFVQGATVLWNNSQRATTFISATQLRAAITANDVKTAGRATVQVQNPSAAAALISNALFFSIAPNCPVGGPPTCLIGDPPALLAESTFTVRQQSAESIASLIQFASQSASQFAFGPEQDGVTYTLTPSGTASNGNPVTFEPPSAGGITGTNNNTNFLAKGAGLVIAGTVSGLGANMANVTLTLLSDLSIMPRNIATNGSGNYTFSECYLNGDYRIAAANSSYSVAPANREIAGLDDSFLSENFAATSTV